MLLSLRYLKVYVPRYIFTYGARVSIFWKVVVLEHVIPACSSIRHTILELVLLLAASCHPRSLRFTSPRTMIVNTNIDKQQLNFWSLPSVDHSTIIVIV
jgi:hypothetical protein